MLQEKSDLDNFVLQLLGIKYTKSYVLHISAGSRYSGATGFGDGCIWVMHETALARLPHVHTTQEDHG